jgi:hypothetical protein
VATGIGSADGGRSRRDCGGQKELWRDLILEYSNEWETDERTTGANGTSHENVDEIEGRVGRGAEIEKIFS